MTTLHLILRNEFKKAQCKLVLKKNPISLEHKKSIDSFFRKQDKPFIPNILNLGVLTLNITQVKIVTTLIKKQHVQQRLTTKMNIMSSFICILRRCEE